MTQTYKPTERRPIASRNRQVWISAAALLARRGITPNTISVAGMAAGILAGFALAATAMSNGYVRRGLWLAGAVLVQLRLLANMLDGMVAVQSGKASPVGELFNEVPDRLSDAATLIGVGFAAGSSPMLGFIAATLAIFVAYVRAEGRVAGAPQDYCGPMAKPHRMFLITLAALYCAAAPTSWQPVAERRGWGVAAGALAIISLGCIITAIRRLRRAARILKAKNP